MKGAAFLFTILISALLLAGWRTPIASSSEGAGTLLKIQNPGNRIGPPPRQFLADRTDTQDAIILGTDPEMDRAMEEQARKEQEKEDKAWNMLQHMYIDRDIGRRPKTTQPDNAPQK